jgi:hypothetical protein
MSGQGGAMQQGKGRIRGKARRYVLTVVAAMLVSLTLGVPAATASTPIKVFNSLSSFSKATHFTQTINFDEFATGTALGNPTVQGPVNIQHSTAATFKTTTSPPYSPVSSPNVLAPYQPDDTLAHGDTTLSFGYGENIRATGLFLILLQGSNQDAIWTSTVTATDAQNRVVTVSVTFRGTIGEQQFIGFKSPANLVSISFGRALRLNTASVVAMDNIVVD